MEAAHRRKGLGIGAPATYRIRVQGYLDERYADYLSGLSITPADLDAEVLVTTFQGRVRDQAELLGVLNTLYGILQLPLLLVELVEIDEEVA